MLTAIRAVQATVTVNPILPGSTGERGAYRILTIGGKFGQEVIDE
jgi:hypothetical protein